MYRESGSEEDFEYLKYYGRRLADDLEQNFGCQVRIHKGSAFLFMGEDCRMGMAFPGNNAVSDILLLCCGKIRGKIEKEEWKVRGDETILVDQLEFEQMIRDVKAKAGAGFTKNYREMPEGEFVREILEHLEWWSFIKREEKDHKVIIYPSAGKVAGDYPDDFMGDGSNEQ